MRRKKIEVKEREEGNYLRDGRTVVFCNQGTII